MSAQVRNRSRPEFKRSAWNGIGQLLINFISPLRGLSKDIANQHVAGVASYTKSVIIPEHPNSLPLWNSVCLT